MSESDLLKRIFELETQNRALLAENNQLREKLGFQNLCWVTKVRKKASCNLNQVNRRLNWLSEFVLHLHHQKYHHHLDFYHSRHSFKPSPLWWQQPDCQPVYWKYGSANGFCERRIQQKIRCARFFFSTALFSGNRPASSLQQANAANFECADVLPVSNHFLRPCKKLYCPLCCWNSL